MTTAGEVLRRRGQEKGGGFTRRDFLKLSGGLAGLVGLGGLMWDQLNRLSETPVSAGVEPPGADVGGAGRSTATATPRSTDKPPATNTLAPPKTATPLQTAEASPSPGVSEVVGKKHISIQELVDNNRVLAEHDWRLANKIPNDKLPLFSPGLLFDPGSSKKAAEIRGDLIATPNGVDIRPVTIRTVGDEGVIGAFPGKMADTGERAMLRVFSHRRLSSEGPRKMQDVGTSGASNLAYNVIAGVDLDEFGGKERFGDIAYFVDAFVAPNSDKLKSPDAETRRKSVLGGTLPLLGTVQKVF